MIEFIQAAFDPDNRFLAYALAYVVCLDLIILTESLLFFNRFFGICFDEVP